MTISIPRNSKTEMILGYREILILEFVLNFIFYGFKSYAVLYFINCSGYGEKNAISIFTAFLSLSYIMSFVGSYISDALIGKPKMLYIGNFFCCIGLLCVAFGPLSLKILGLALLSFGAGALKPILAATLSQMCQHLSSDQQEHRFRMFYISLNTGSFTGPILASLVKSWWGWEAGLLALGSSVLLIFSGVNHLFCVESLKLTAPPRYVAALITTLASLAGLVAVLNLHAHLSHLITLVVLVSTGYLLYLLFRAEPHERRPLERLIAYLAVFAFFVLLYEQAGSSIMMFFDRAVDRNLWGWIIEPPMLLSLNPILIITMGLLITRFKEPQQLSGLSTSFKIAVGFIFVGLGFFFLALGAASSTGKVALGWVLASVACTAQGELFIAPVTLACVSKLSPKRLMSTMMAFWLVAIAYGVYGAGLIAAFSIPSQDASSPQQLQEYSIFFGKMGMVSWMMSLFLVISSKLYRRFQQASL